MKLHLLDPKDRKRVEWERSKSFKINPDKEANKNRAPRRAARSR